MNSESAVVFCRSRGFGGQKPLVVRDDQITWAEAIDLAKECKSKGKMLVFIDLGGLTLAELEWLVSSGTVILSYPEAGRTWAEMLLLKTIARRKHGLVIYAYGGKFKSEEEKREAYLGWRQMARGGIDFHLSNRHQFWEPEAIVQLAADCRLGRGWFVYYHHGFVEPWLINLVREGAWVHLSDRFYQASQKENWEEMLRGFSRRQVRLILHAESMANELKEIIDRYGGFIIYNLPPPPSTTALASSRPKSLPFRAYHLDPKAML